MIDYDHLDMTVARIQIRFALSIVDECRSAWELANVMEACIAG